MSSALAVSRTSAFALGSVDGSGHCRRKRCQDDLVALAVDAEHAMAVDLAELLDVGAGGFKDAQPEEPEHGDQGEIVGVLGVAGGAEQRLELQVGEPEVGDSGGTRG